MTYRALALLALPSLLACNGQLSEFTAGEIALEVTDDEVTITSALYKEGGCSSYEGLAATINGDAAEASAFADGGGLFPSFDCVIEAVLVRTVPAGVDDESVTAQFSAGEETVVLEADGLLEHPAFSLTTPAADVVPGATIAFAINPPLAHDASGYIDSTHTVTVTDSVVSVTLPADEPTGARTLELRLDILGDDCTGISECTASSYVVSTLGFSVGAP